MNIANLLAWMIQVLILGSVGCLLLMLLRIRHPRTQLAYCHALLAICLVLPLVQPWKHPVIVTESTTAAPAEQSIAAPITSAKTPARENAAPITTPLPTPKPAATPIPWTKFILWTLASGIAARFIFLLAGLFQIRRFRIASMPLYPVPEPVQAAAALTHADALFCISAETRGPVMLGWLAPIILLPEAFLALGEEAQCGIACHELLHVRRHDWLVTMFEEIAGAILWFNPAIWMLLAQTGLAREQLVDEETVLLTSAREPYIDALLAIARGKPMDLVPAPLFLRRRHLTQRMHLLLKEVSVSKFRLISSYCSMTAALALAGWLAFTTFPLIGSPQFQTAPAAAAQPAPEPRQLAQNFPAQKPRAIALNTTSAAPPIPFDAHEPVTGNIQIASTAADRSTLLALFERASQNSKLHIAGLPPWKFDVSFSAQSASGSSSGRLTETWLNGQRWRWTIDQPGYSLARVASRAGTVEEQHVTGIPMRAQMLREAIMWAVQGGPFNSQLRSAQISFNGKPTTCILASAVTGADAQTQSRLWDESEYCIDNASGLMLVHSIAPGTYFVYDYSANQQFHGRTEPSRISIYVAGAQVADAQFTMTDAGQVDDALLTPTPAMIANGPVIVTASPQRSGIMLPNPLGTGAQTVIVHTVVNGAGNVVEAELSAASDPALVQIALEFVKKANLPHQFSSQSQDYVTVRFVPPSQ